MSWRKKEVIIYDGNLFRNNEENEINIKWFSLKIKLLNGLVMWNFIIEKKNIWKFHKANNKWKNAIFYCLWKYLHVKMSFISWFSIHFLAELMRENSHKFTESNKMQNPIYLVGVQILNNNTERSLTFLFMNPYMILFRNRKLI